MKYTCPLLLGILCLAATEVLTGQAPPPAAQGGSPGTVTLIGTATMLDDFSGYAPFGFRAARWGDYSAAVADENGDVWVANEHIPNAPRTQLTNWGTFVSRVHP